MVFSSLEFVFIFFPIFLALYYSTQKKYRNYTLLIGSIIFYIIGSWDTPLNIFLIIISTIFNYILCLLIYKYKSKYILIFGIIYNLSWLFLFKYYDFFTSIIFNITKLRLNELNLVLPIGISFYTFQIISYLIDVYKNKCEAEKSIFKFETSILMFPKLISGPITDNSVMQEEINQRTYNLEKFTQGCKLFILGMGFKVLLADRIGILWNEILSIGFESISTPLAWMGVIAFSLQIYFDFYGYTLIARGIGKMLGFELPENFQTPYLSLSMTEFFRRWHISLGKWFKDYVYIPLGGNRKGMLRTVINLFIVWILTGLWHGASYNFILWGIVIFILIVNEKLWLKKILDKYHILGHVYMIILIPLTWTIFAITDFTALGAMFCKLFPFLNNNINTIYALDFIKYGKMYGILIIIGIICCTKLPQKIFLEKENNNFELIILLIIFWISVYYLYIGLNNPFLYFNF